MSRSDVPITPFPRLLAAMFSSNVGAFFALLTPLQLLLTLKVTTIAGTGAAAAFGVITGLGALFALVANPIAGRISDRTAHRFGKRRTWILTGSLAGSLVVFATAFTTEVWQVALFWCATQAIFNVQLAATAALFADQVPAERRGTVSGMIGFAAAIGPLIGLAVVSAVSRPVVQWGIVAAVSVVLGALAVVLLRDAPASGRIGMRPGELLTSFWLNPWRHPAFGWAWLVRFLISCAYASNTYNAFFMMEQFGIATDQVGGVVVIMSLIAVGLLAITSAVAGPISDRLRRQKPFVIAAGVLTASAMVLMATATDTADVYVASAVLGIGFGLFISVDNALSVRVLPSGDDAGKDLGIINLANTLPQSVVPFIAPFLLALGGFSALYATLAVLGVLGAGAVLRLPEVGREGDRRWAVITRLPATVAAVPVPSEEIS